MSQTNRTNQKRKSRAKKIPFYTWIDEEGIDTVAELLGVVPATVRYWRRGDTYPHPRMMRTIRDLTNGLVGYEQIIDGSCP